jgi:putative hydrolase of the HAD superfamily
MTTLSLSSQHRKFAIVFDIDDTLYLERDFVFSGYRAVSSAVASKYGFFIYDRLIESFLAGQRGDLFTPVLNEKMDDVREDFVKELVKIYRSHVPDIKPFDGIPELLKKIGAYCKLAIISDGFLEVQKRKLGALKIADRFNHIAFTDQWGHEFWKPHPRGYEDCSASLGIEPESMIYIGDNPEKDFIGARNAGLKCIRLRVKHGLHYDKEAEGSFAPDTEVNSVKELHTVIAIELGMSRNENGSFKTC